jgi:hypothetical protein
MNEGSVGIISFIRVADAGKTAESADWTWLVTADEFPTPRA